MTHYVNNTGVSNPCDIHYLWLHAVILSLIVPPCLVRTASFIAGSTFECCGKLGVSPTQSLPLRCTARWFKLLVKNGRYLVVSSSNSSCFALIFALVPSVKW